MKLRQLTPSLNDPQRMATAILHGVLESQTGDRTSRQTVDPAKEIRDALEGLLGRRK